WAFFCSAAIIQGSPLDGLWDFGRTPNSDFCRVRCPQRRRKCICILRWGQRTLQPERFNLSEDCFTDELASALAAARGVEFCQEPGVDGEGNQFLTSCAGHLARFWDKHRTAQEYYLASRAS